MRRRNHLSLITRVPSVAQDEDQIIKLGTITQIVDIFRLIPRQSTWKVGCIDNDGCSGAGGDDGGGGAGGAGL
jgi:hypothetical protein